MVLNMIERKLTLCSVTIIVRHRRDEDNCEVYSVRPVRIPKLIVIFTVRRMVSLSVSSRGKP